MISPLQATLIDDVSLAVEALVQALPAQHAAVLLGDIVGAFMSDQPAEAKRDFLSAYEASSQP